MEMTATGASEPRSSGESPLKVDVLVDLIWSPAAGGHVKCWERLAEAALAMADRLDLTVHFSGPAAACHVLGPTVRYRIHPPVFSTARLPFLSHIPDHTDLAPFHPGLARALGRSCLIHTTDAFFAFARTARLMARLRRIPLVNSVHTDTPRYSRLFTAETIRRHLGSGWLARALLERGQLDQRTELRMRRQLARYQQGCAFALVSRSEEQAEALAHLGAERVGLLRRGIDRVMFDPGRRDRTWLEAAFGIPAARTLVLFVGRVNPGKNVMLVAEAVRRLLARGLPVHLFCAGEGRQRPEIQAMLGDAATCPGMVDRQTLARLYASADIFAMPSEIEIFANVVMEALASGLPALVTDGGGMGRVVRAGENGLVLPGADADCWAEAMAALIADPARRIAMAQAARRAAMRDLPSWQDVLSQDLLPVWQQALRQTQPLIAARAPG